MAESKFMKKLTELQNYAKLNLVETSESLPDFKKAYEIGIRARNDETGIYFRKSNGVKTYVYHDNGWANWALLSDYESKTWKERHAKGVPVKMTYEEWAKCLDSRNIRIAGHNGVYRGGICVQSYPPGGDTSEYFASFCNFRYKQSWLDKKGGEHGIS